MLKYIYMCVYIYIYIYIYIYFCSAGVWTQGLHLEPQHHQAPLFCAGFFRDRVLQTIWLGWLRTTVLLISVSWVARITGVSHWFPATHKPLTFIKVIKITCRAGTVCDVWVSFHFSIYTSKYSAIQGKI
jgi:hypothetical protein